MINQEIIDHIGRECNFPMRGNITPQHPLDCGVMSIAHVNTAPASTIGDGEPL
jgi:hypothetical protein